MKMTKGGLAAAAAGILLAVAPLSCVGGKREVVDRFGWLTGLRGRTAGEIRNVLPQGVILLRSRGLLPPGVPSQIREIMRPPGTKGRVLVWRMCPDGKKWRFFKAFGIDAYLAMGEDIAVVYEAHPVGTTRMAFVPIAVLYFEISGTCKKVERTYLEMQMTVRDKR